MRKNIIFFLSLSVLVIQSLIISPVNAQTNNKVKNAIASQNTKYGIIVTNELKNDRQSETVTVDWKTLTKRLPNIKPDYFQITELATGKHIPHQLIDIDSDGKFDQLIFQTDFVSREPTKRFSVNTTTERVSSSSAPESKTFGRYVPERKDDFAWENDRVAFRTYGKALESELVSSGIDVWTKRTRNLLIDKWYKLGEEAYHKDTGEGLDMYSVRTSRGCGGSGIWDGKQLRTSRNYKTWKVIANGPIRTIFELTYEPWDANGTSVSEVKRFTLDAGQNLFQVESTLKFDGKDTLDYAFGVARHKEWKSATDYSKENGWLNVWEITGTENGSLGCAVAIDSKQISGRADNELQTPPNGDVNHLIITKAQSGKPLNYYVGAGWTKSGDFADEVAWKAYLDNFAKNKRSPLKVSFFKQA